MINCLLSWTDIWNLKVVTYWYTWNINSQSLKSSGSVFLWIFYLKKKCFVLEKSRFLCFCEIQKFKNLWHNHKHCSIREITLCLFLLNPKYYQGCIESKFHTGWPVWAPKKVSYDKIYFTTLALVFSLPFFFNAKSPIFAIVFFEKPPELTTDPKWPLDCQVRKVCYRHKNIYLK